jgi:hypothetical protein
MFRSVTILEIADDMFDTMDTQVWEGLSMEHPYEVPIKYHSLSRDHRGAAAPYHLFLMFWEYVALPLPIVDLISA